MQNPIADYLDLGWALVPLRGKRPILEDWSEHPITNVADARKYWPGANVGICTGKSGLLVLDIDPRNGGKKGLASLVERHGPLPPTALVRTGGNGLHYYFTAPVGPIGNSSGKLAPGVDVKCIGGQVVAPPSVHPQSGRSYEWLVPPDAEGVADCPDWIGTELQRVKVDRGPIEETDSETGSDDGTAIRRAAAYVARMPPSVEGQNGSGAAFRVACVLAQDFGLSMHGARDVMDRFNARCEPPWSPGELDHKLRDAYRVGRARGGRDRGWMLKGGDSLRLDRKASEDGEGSVKPTLRNVTQILNNDPRWIGRLAWDEARTRPTLDGELVTDAGTTGIALALDGSYGLSSINRATLEHAIGYVTRQNTTNPLREEIESVEWDGCSRVGEWLIKGFGAPDHRLSRSYARHWAIQAVARAYRPGCQADSVLVLVGPQGVGKSTGLRVLAGDDWFSDTDIDLRSKDRFLQIHSVWIYEWSELGGIGTARMDTIKAFLTSRDDRFRSPYDKRVEVHLRRCVFAATTNRKDMLRDTTGSRRFWPVEVGGADLDYLRTNRCQIWAEALVRLREGEPWHLSLEMEQERVDAATEYQQEDPWEGALDEWIREDPSDFRTDHVLSVVLGVPVSQQDQRDSRRVGELLRARGYVLGTVSIAGKKKRLWRRATLPALPLNAVRLSTVTGNGVTPPRKKKEREEVEGE